MQINLVKFAIFMLLRINTEFSLYQNRKIKFKQKTILSQKSSFRQPT